MELQGDTQIGGTHFDRTVAVRRVGPAEAGRASFVAEFDESWSSLRGIHGGYAVATVAGALRNTLPDRSVRTIAASFLRPAAPGPADIEVSVLRAGRSLATVDAVVRQQERDVIVVRATLRSHGDAESWSLPLSSRPAPLEACLPFTAPPGIAHFEQAEMRIDPQTPVTFGGADDARVAGHIRPSEPRAIDAAWLVMAGDWFPPSPFRRLAPPSGGVSIDYTVHVHRTLPVDPQRWLEGVFDARVGEGGIALEHGTLATPDGVAVAETFHTRWIAGH